MTKKSLNALAMPMVISFTFRFLFTLVDLVYAARIKEDDPYAAAAIGLFIPIQTLFIAIWVGLSAGFTASISQAFGRRDELRVRALKAAMVRILVGLVPLMFGFAGLLLLVTPHMNLEPGLRRDFLVYSLTLLCSMPFCGFLSIYPDSIVKAHHDSVTTMIAGFASTIANVVLNTVFVFAFGWGLAGIAAATALSRYAGLGYAAWRCRALERSRLASTASHDETTWVRRPVGEILGLGLPGCLAYSLIFLEEWITTQVLVNQPDQKVYLAAFAVYNRCTQLATMPAIATGVAVLPFVARYSAARDSTIGSELRRSIGLTAILVAAIAIPIGWLFPQPVADYFVQEAAEKAGSGVTRYLALIPVAALVALPYLLLRPVFEATGAPRVGVRITVLKSLAFCVPLQLAGYWVSVVARFDPLLGLLLGTVCGQALASTMTAIVCRRVLASAGSANDTGIGQSAPRAAP